MVTRPLYQRGRHGAPICGPHGERPVQVDRDLIEKLRAIRDRGNEAMTAVEEYDPDLSVKLSACKNDADATDLLTSWLERRVDVLKQTQTHLRAVWEAAQSKQNSARQ